MNGIAYRPGDWQVVIEDAGVVAVPSDAAPERVLAVARMLQGGTPALMEVIDVLSGGSIAALGSFAIALSSADGMRFAVRGGAVTVRVADAGGASEFSGADVSTWSERFVADIRGFELSLGAPAGEVVYPIRSGIVLAASVESGEAGSNAVVQGDAVQAEPIPDAATDIPDAATDIPDAATDVPDTAAAPTAVESVPEPISSVPDAEEQPSLEPEPEPEPESEPEPVDSVPVVEPDADLDDDGSVQHTLLPTDFTYVPGDESELDATIASVPAAPLPPAPVPPAVDQSGDHDGATISLAEARRLRAAAPAAPDAPTEVLPVAASPQPASNGRIRLSTGQVLELDRTVIIGRRPRSTRASGATLPHLVAVESPQQDISRNHLEIRPEGDSVVIIDLHTTNGSTLLRPGVDPMRLHPGEQTLVLDGDTVDLGDGVTVDFEGLA